MKVLKMFSLLFLEVILICGCIGQNTNLQAASGEENKEFTIRLSKFKLSPDVIIVNRGETVRINVIVVQGKHNLFIDGYNLRTEIALSPNTQVIEFAANQVGTFDMWCEVKDHRALGMEGLLIVN